MVSVSPTEAKPKLDLFKTYLKLIENAVGSNLFRNLYATWNDKEVDLLEDGELSCAMFVSAILLQVFKIDEPHATVASTVRHMKEWGWVVVPTDTATHGDVLVWEPITFEDGSKHPHMGFFIGNGEAISNSREQKTPLRHHWTYNGTRKITEVLRWQKSWEPVKKSNEGK